MGAVQEAMQQAIDPRNYLEDERLLDGSLIHIRAIRPDDRERLLEHFEGLSPQSKYFRFFGIRRGLGESELTRLSRPDFTSHVALLATQWHEGREKVIGVGRYLVGAEARARTAEVALAVLDEHQGQGIGTLLIEHLAMIAQAGGVEQFLADVLGANTRMLEMLKDLGAPVQSQFDSGVVHEALSTAGIVRARAKRKAQPGSP